MPEPPSYRHEVDDAVINLIGSLGSLTTEIERLQTIAASLSSTMQRIVDDQERIESELWDKDDRSRIDALKARQDRADVRLNGAWATIGLMITACVSFLIYHFK